MNDFDSLIEFLMNLKFDKIPQEVVEKTEICVLDFLANIFGGSQLEEGRQIADFVRGLGDRNEATVLSFAYKTSCRQGAMANGTIGALLQAHDGFKYGGNHPSSSVIPAALAIGEYFRLNGKELLVSIVVGYEVANRISAAIHPSHSLKGFAPTGTVGTFASAATVSKLLNFNEDKFTNAIGIAGFLLPISTYETLLGKYSVTPIHGGFASKVGIEAAMLANAGYRGCKDILQGSYSKGFCLITSENPRFEKLLDGMGERYSITDVYLKPFPACRHTHGPVELILNLIETEGIVWQDVEKVTVRTYKMATQFAQYTSSSSELYECQMSLPYVIAVALMDGHLGTDQFTKKRREDPAGHQFSRKVEVIEDSELTSAYPAITPSFVEIVLRNGKKVEGRIDVPKGDPGKPLSTEELFEKARNYCKRALTKEKSNLLISRVINMEEIQDLSDFISWMHTDN